MTHDEAMKYAFIMIALSAANGVIHNHYFMGQYHNGMKVRVAVCNLIYKKVIFEDKLLFSLVKPNANTFIGSSSIAHRNR